MSQDVKNIKKQINKYIHANPTDLAANKFLTFKEDGTVKDLKALDSFAKFYMKELANDNVINLKAAEDWKYKNALAYRFIGNYFPIL